MRFDWPYFTLDSEGRLRDEDGEYAFSANIPRFTTPADAEQYLVDHDIRGNVREEVLQITYDGQ